MIAVIFFVFSNWKSYRILNQNTKYVINKVVFMVNRDDKTVGGGNEVNIDQRCAPGSELGFSSHCNKGGLFFCTDFLSLYIKYHLSRKDYLNFECL